MGTSIIELFDQLPSRILDLLRDAGVCAEKMGFEAYAVGGLVRDLFLQRDNFDVDVVIEGDGIAFASRFSVDRGARLKYMKSLERRILCCPMGSRLMWRRQEPRYMNGLPHFQLLVLIS